MGILSVPPASLTYLTNQLTGNVTLTNADTYYDGPSLSLTAGTWLLSAVISVQDPAGTDCCWTAKLWDGTTVACSAEAWKRAAAGTGPTMHLVGVVVLASTTTWKVSAGASNASTVMLTTPSRLTAGNIANTAGTLVAVKIA